MTPSQTQTFGLRILTSLVKRCNANNKATLITISKLSAADDIKIWQGLNKNIGGYNNKPDYSCKRL